MAYLHDWLGKYMMGGIKFNVPNVKLITPKSVEGYGNDLGQQLIIVDDKWTGTASSQYKLFTDRQILDSVQKALTDSDLSSFRAVEYASNSRKTVNRYVFFDAEKAIDVDGQEAFRMLTIENNYNRSGKIHLYFGMTFKGCSNGLMVTRGDFSSIDLIHKNGNELPDMKVLVENYVTIQNIVVNEMLALKDIKVTVEPGKEKRKRYDRSTETYIVEEIDVFRINTEDGVEFLYSNFGDPNQQKAAFDKHEQVYAPKFGDNAYSAIQAITDMVSNSGKRAMSTRIGGMIRSGNAITQILHRSEPKEAVSEDEDVL